MSSPYCNNLDKGNVVMHGARRAVVAMQPRETSVNVACIYDGTESVRYIPIEDLRLVVNGVPEDVPPFDGESPRPKPKPQGDTLTSVVWPRSGLTPAEVEALCRAEEHQTFGQFCVDLKVTPKERVALATCLAILRATETLKLAKP